MKEYVYVVQMDVPEQFEDDFNRVYDTQHVPSILKVPGVHGCHRFRLEHGDVDGVPQYLAIYELDSPDLPKSDAWKAASDKGDWATLIRPHTTNRVRSIFRRIP